MTELLPAQARLDREMAPVLGSCPGCGAELYEPAALERFGGLCPRCARLAPQRPPGPAWPEQPNP